MATRTLALLATCHFVSVCARRSTDQGSDYLAVSEDGTAAKSTKFPPLCDSDVVREACSDINDGAESRQISSEVLRNLLSANGIAMSAFWHAAGLPTDHPLDGVSGYSVECEQLCSAVVTYAGANGVLPKTSDVGCYNVGQETFCDLPLKPTDLPNLGPGPDQDLPNLHDSEVMHKMSSLIAKAESNTTRSFVSISEDLYANGTAINYGMWELAERVANIFRIYPTRKPEPGIQDSLDEGNSLAEASDVQRVSSDRDRLHQQKVVEAKAFVGIVIRAFNKKKTQTEMTKWFGSGAYHSSASRAKILSVLNSVDHMINNVYGVFNGPQCTSNTYAYVYPKGYSDCTLNQLHMRPCTKYQGKYVFYLCGLYFNRPAEMVETLVHEGSHHATAYTDDVQNMYGTTAYGRSTCTQLGREEPQKAIKNADNYCYYIQDVASKEYPGPGAGAAITTSKRPWSISGNDYSDYSNSNVNHIDGEKLGHAIGFVIMSGVGLVACCCAALCACLMRSG